MNKNRQFLALGMAIIFVAVGLLVGRSQAQPDQVRRADPPFLLKIGKHRINPNQMSYAFTWNITPENHPDSHLTIFSSGHDLDFEFGTDGRAEALLEWLDAHTTELKPKVVKKK